MFNNLENLQLELIIQKTKSNRFKATCPLFPTCKGFGDTKENAIEKLCNAISRHIAKISNEYLKQQLLSKDFSEVITDPSQKDSFQHRIIDFNAVSNTKKVFLKPVKDLFDSPHMESVLSSFQSKPSAMPGQLSRRGNVTFQDERESKDLSFLNDALIDNETPFSNMPPKDDGLLFGITLCLN